MPRAPKKCGREGCETRVSGARYCPAHKSQWEYNRAPRTSTAGHKAWRLAVLNRDQWQCRIAGPGCTRAATIADHILNHADCIRAGINPDTISNGQGLCAPCHAVKTKAEARAGRARQPRAKRPLEKHPGLL